MGIYQAKKHWMQAATDQYGEYLYLDSKAQYNSLIPLMTGNEYAVQGGNRKEVGSPHPRITIPHTACVANTVCTMSRHKITTTKNMADGLDM